MPQISAIKSLGKRCIDRGECLFRYRRRLLLPREPNEAGRSPEFESSGSLGPCQIRSPLEAGNSPVSRCLLLREQLSLQPIRFWLVMMLVLCFNHFQQ